MRGISLPRPGAKALKIGSSRWTAAFGPPGLLVAPFAWVATELLRNRTFFNFPWCLLGYSQHANLPFVQVARLTAVYGVSFLVALVSALLAYVAVEPRAAPRRRALVGLGLVLGGSWAWGSWVLDQPLPEAGTIVL